MRPKPLPAWVGVVTIGKSNGGNQSIRRLRAELEPRWGYTLIDPAKTSAHHHFGRLIADRGFDYNLAGTTVGDVITGDKIAGRENTDSPVWMPDHD